MKSIRCLGCGSHEVGTYYTWGNRRYHECHTYNCTWSMYADVYDGIVREALEEALEEA